MRKFDETRPVCLYRLSKRPRLRTSFPEDVNNDVELYMLLRLWFSRLSSFLLLLLWSCITGAHHSTAIYDSENPIELQGRVVEWKFTNPHCIIILAITADDGQTQIWNVEGSNTAGLYRQGWTPETLQKDDQIILTVRPLRSGATGGNYSNPRWKDGSVIDPRNLPDRG